MQPQCKDTGIDSNIGATLRGLHSSQIWAPNPRLTRTNPEQCLQVPVENRQNVIRLLLECLNRNGPVAPFRMARDAGAPPPAAAQVDGGHHRRSLM